MPHRKMELSGALAVNLAYYMGRAKLSQNGLAKLSKIPQTTISLLLHPERRIPLKSGKTPSPTLSQIEVLARFLGCEAWELLRPMGDRERKIYEAIEMSYKSVLSAAEPQ
jgi:transcriptional regulator with XRE-family HTH domain